jgi:hypothetical protein
LSALYALGSATDLDLSYYTGLPINCITGRRNELVEAKHVRDSGRRKLNPYSRKPAIVWEPA